MLTLSERWRETYPDAAVGILAMGQVANPDQHSELAAAKTALETSLRAQFAGFDRARLRALPVLQAYHAFYRQFRKTYHVQLQLESVALKGKSIPSVAALVESMFMAELRSQLLTAGHDLDAVQLPLRAIVATGTESFTRMNGQEQQLKPGDLAICDAVGPLSTVIYGPDRRTQITPTTRRVLFTVYAVPGISAARVLEHLADLEANVRCIAPETVVEERRVYLVAQEH
jgi:DNA/RNA-binding domain of Phe-tRNA-synthetase-like protein